MFDERLVILSVEKPPTEDQVETLDVEVNRLP